MGKENRGQLELLRKNSSLEVALKYMKKSCKLVEKFREDCGLRNGKDSAIAYALYELGASENRKEHLKIFEEVGNLSLPTLMCEDFLKYHQLLHEQVLAGEKRAREYLQTGRISPEDKKNLKPFLTGNSREY